MPSDRITPGGTAINARALNVRNWVPIAATSGTDTAVVVTVTYYTSLFIPGDMLVSSINVLLGSVSTNGLILAALYTEAGTLIANSALAGVATSTAATSQAIALTVPYLLTGPRYVIVAIQANNTSDKFRSIPAQCSGGALGGSQTGTVFGTLPAPLTISSTNFTADKAPIVFLS